MIVPLTRALAERAAQLVEWEYGHAPTFTQEPSAVDSGTGHEPRATFFQFSAPDDLVFRRIYTVTVTEASS